MAEAEDLGKIGGMFRALRSRALENPGALLCALQLLSIYLLAAVFFGSLRLRMPYDPYAWILALPILGRASAWARGRLTGRRDSGT